MLWLRFNPTGMNKLQSPVVWVLNDVERNCGAFCQVRSDFDSSQAPGDMPPHQTTIELIQTSRFLLAPFVSPLPSYRKDSAMDPTPALVTKTREKGSPKKMAGSALASNGAQDRGKSGLGSREEVRSVSSFESLYVVCVNVDAIRPKVSLGRIRGDDWYEPMSTPCPTTERKTETLTSVRAAYSSNNIRG
ncbi:hypothetical protein EV363DRAFT_1304891 [Boletus edulis]|nr:hypothetical protein EV363DRAFT_1304891 [Boletus edulis]